MGSDSKFIRWYGSVVNYIDSFSMEPDVEFLSGSEQFESETEDISKIDQELHCIDPIPFNEDCLHPAMTQDHSQINDGNSSSVKRTFAMMQEETQCCSTPMSQTDDCLQVEMVDQMGDRNSTSLKRTFNMIQEDSQCCSTPIPQTDDCLHAGMVDQMGDGNSISPIRFAMLQEDPQCSSTPIPTTDDCLQTGVVDHRQMGDGNSTSLKRTFTMMQEDPQCCSTPIRKASNLPHLPKSILTMEKSSDHCSTTFETTDFLTDHNQMGIETLIVQESVERCRTFVVPRAYFSESGIMDQDQTGARKSDPQKRTSATKEIRSCLRKRSLVPDCGESSSRVEREASHSRELMTPPASKKPSALRTSKRKKSQPNLERSSEISLPRPRSSRKKEIDPLFGDIVRKTVKQDKSLMTPSETAVRSAEEVLVEVFDRIATRAARLTAHRKRKTLSTEDLRMAIEMTLPTRMASKANLNASIRVQKKDG